MKLLLSHIFRDNYKCEGNKNTCLLIVRPVKVGSKEVGSKEVKPKGDSKKLTSQFSLYEPPEEYV